MRDIIEETLVAVGFLGFMGALWFVWCITPA